MACIDWPHFLGTALFLVIFCALAVMIVVAVFVIYGMDGSS